MKMCVLTSILILLYVSFSSSVRLFLHHQVFKLQSVSMTFDLLLTGSFCYHSYSVVNGRPFLWWWSSFWMTLLWFLSVTWSRTLSFQSPQAAEKCGDRAGWLQNEKNSEKIKISLTLSTDTSFALSAFITGAEPDCGICSFYILTGVVKEWKISSKSQKLCVWS